ncbi:MAG: hypothetical protein IJ298_01250 [Ruminococcus sp.]|nr:hypothetical protein [Ruminococcus sp.]
MVYLYDILLFLIPILSIVFFIISLVMYIRIVKQNKKCPDSTLKPKITAWKILLIISSVIAVIMLAFIISIIVLMYMVVAYM